MILQSFQDKDLCNQSRLARWLCLMIAMGALVCLIVWAYSAGFVTVSADEFAKTVIAVAGITHPRMWFGQTWMPLHLCLIAMASALTDDLMLASRLVSIGFGLVLVIALWDLGRRFGGDLAGGLSAVFCATHPLVVLLSGTGMADICYVALLSCALSVYLRFAEAPAPVGPISLRPAE